MFNIFFVFLAFFVFFWQQDKQQTNQYNIYVETYPDKLSYYVGETVNLRTTVYFNEDRLIKVYFSEFRDIAMLYRKIDGKFMEYSSENLLVMRSRCSVVFPIEFTPNEKKDFSGSYFFNTSRNQFVLNEPGKHEIKFIFKFTDLEGNSLFYKSNAVQVTVVNPSEEEQLVLSQLRDPLLAKLIEGDLTEVDDLNQITEKLEIFLAKNPNSLYMPEVKRRLRFNFQVYENKLNPKLKSIYTQIKRESFSD